MPFTSDSARAAAAKKSGQVLTIEAQASQDRAHAAKHKKTARYYIKAPLANADASVRANNVRLILQVHPGPIEWPEGSGTIVEREPGKVILLEGEGFTDDPIVAKYLQEQWPDLEITQTSSDSNLAQYQEELEDLKAQLV